MQTGVNQEMPLMSGRKLVQEDFVITQEWVMN